MMTAESDSICFCGEDLSPSPFFLFHFFLFVKQPNNSVMVITNKKNSFRSCSINNKASTDVFV